MHRSNPRRLCFSTLTLALLVCSCLCVSPYCATAGRGADLHYSVSWIGNSFSGKTAWVQQDVEGLWVEPDGTLFTNVRWDEAGGNVQQYRNGQLIAMARHTHGWGYEGGEAVAANSKYLFIVQNVENEGGGLKGSSWPPKGRAWSGVSRRLRSDITRPRPSPGDTARRATCFRALSCPWRNSTSMARAVSAACGRPKKNCSSAARWTAPSRSMMPKPCNCSAPGKSSGRIGCAWIVAARCGSCKGRTSSTNVFPSILTCVGQPCVSRQPADSCPRRSGSLPASFPRRSPLTLTVAFWLPTRERTSKSKSTTTSTRRRSSRQRSARREASLPDRSPASSATCGSTARQPLASMAKAMSTSPPAVQPTAAARSWNATRRQANAAGDGWAWSSST